MPDDGLAGVFRSVRWSPLAFLKPVVLSSVLFVACKMFIARKLSASAQPDYHTPSNTASFLASAALVKLVLSLVHILVHRVFPSRHHALMTFPAHSHSTLNLGETVSTLLEKPSIASRHSRLQLAHEVIPVIYMRYLYQHIALQTHHTITARDLALLAGLIPITVFIVSCAITTRRYLSLQYSAILFAGIALLQPTFLVPYPSRNILPAILALIAFSLYLVICQEFYRSTRRPLHFLNVVMFSAEFTVSAFIAVNASGFLGSKTNEAWPETTALPAILIHGLIGYLSSFVLRLGSLSTLMALNAAPVLILAAPWGFRTPDTYSITSVAAMCLLLYGVVLSLVHRPDSLNEPRRDRDFSEPFPYHLATLEAPSSTVHSPQRYHTVLTRWRRLIFATMAISLTFIWMLMPPPIPVRQPPGHRAILESPFFGDFVSDAFLLPQSTVAAHCDRRRLVSHDYIANNPRPSDNDTHAHHVGNAFDDTLLIVFFSHARYDINLDHYLEMYTPYFPNIIFVGPRTREDRGHNHSHDVVVDSYQSHEDLTDDYNYRMAGRLAHHKLYTVLNDHVSDEDCYEGYLWAPFDVFLNVPRLLRFDRDKLWYHSPFGTVVPNPAIKNETHHAPPANISPDPYGNVTEIWRHWGPDWWWGEPHFGLNVCITAFEKTPQYMRTQLASLTGNETRLMGGSSDTIYFPRRYHSSLMHVLGLFLETNCFLEIALPTTTHLIVPPEDEIQFLDHWWIYELPFNATFVRQQWKLDYEVDTFHTFHWGDIEDGKFQPHIGIIDEARAVMRESFERQQFKYDGVIIR